MKKSRVVFAIVLAVVSVLVLATMMVSVYATTGNTTEFAGGSGTQAYPYLIKTKEHLNNVRIYPNAYFELKNDIEFTEEDFEEDGAFYNDGFGWEPICGGSKFSGFFDGNGYSIIGYQIYDATTEYVGLFGYVSGSIENLIVDGTIDMYVTSSTVYVGGVCGYLTGTIENCQNNVTIYSTETVSSSTYIDSKVNIGGVVGYSVGTIDSCVNQGSIYVAPSPIDYSNLYGYVGGITGYNAKGVISNCENKGTVEVYDKPIAGLDRYSYYYLGGVGGYSTGTVNSCNNSGEISVNNPSTTNNANYSYRYIGGILAYSNKEINNCSNMGRVHSMGAFAYAGGIVAENTGSIKNSNNLALISGMRHNPKTYSGWLYTYVAGIAGESSGSIDACYNTGEVQWSRTGASEPVYTGGISGYSTSNISNCYNVATIMAGMYYGDSGGIVGESKGNISSCYDIGSSGYRCGIAGFTSNLTNNCFYLDYAIFGTTVRDVAVACSPKQLQEQSTFVGFDFEKTWVMSTEDAYPLPVLRNNPHVTLLEENTIDFSGGRGTPFDPYIIKNAEQLNNIRNYPNSHFALANDIVFDENYNWVSIPKVLHSF